MAFRWRADGGPTLYGDWVYYHIKIASLIALFDFLEKQQRFKKSSSGNFKRQSKDYKAIQSALCLNMLHNEFLQIET